LNNRAQFADGRGLTLSLDPWGRMVAVLPDGVEHVGVEPVRAFPITDHSHWVVLCDADGREVVCLESLELLDPDSRRVLEGELALREFVPIIRHVLSVSSDGTPSDWEVDTDRGRTRFTLDNEEDVRRLGPERVLITDARKLRFQVPDLRALDGFSRRILERFL
jgi:hypothetical protein